jgi:transcriptional regulatory protein RtcR
VSSDFQLIAGTNCNLFKQVREGKFREDLLARINLWHYQLPSLKNRIEDLKPNIQHELELFTQKAGYKVDFNKSAKTNYLAFSYSAHAPWKANFRDLNASITRMSTLAKGGRITEDVVDTEIKRLQYDWQGHDGSSRKTDKQAILEQVLGKDAIAELDLFEQIQLSEVLCICQQSKSLAEAGRTLFNVSREKRSSNNDSHRLRTYLGKYGIVFKTLKKQ